MLYKKSKNTTVQKLSAIVLMTIIGIAAFYIQSEAQKRSSSHKYTISQPRIDTVIMETPSGEMQTVVVKTKADTIYETADVMPEFYGGEKEMMKFIVDNLVYPEEAIRKKIEGRIQVTFTVTNEGDIIRVKAVRVPSNGALLAMEAERCVSKMPKWKPGSIKGKKVPVNFSLPITFSLK